MSKLVRLAVRPSLWPPLRFGVVASVEHTTVPFAPRFGTVLDVGASRGQFALFALNQFPSARLICFEPIPGSLAMLGRVTGGRAEAHPVALGAGEGRAPLNVAARDDSSSLLPIGRRQVSEFPGTAHSSTIEVRVTPLDDFVDASMPAPRLLKIDVQGFEAEVLKGAVCSLPLIEEVLVECSFLELYDGQALAGDVIAMLREHGFGLIGVHGVAWARDGSPLQADFHFRRAPEHAGA